MRDGMHSQHREESIRNPQPVVEHGAGDAMALAFVGFAIGALAHDRKFVDATFERALAQSASYELGPASGSTRDEPPLRNTMRKFDSRDCDEQASRFLRGDPACGTPRHAPRSRSFKKQDSEAKL